MRSASASSEGAEQHQTSLCTCKVVLYLHLPDLSRRSYFAKARRSDAWYCHLRGCGVPPLHFSRGAGPFLEFQLLSEAESLRRSSTTCFACANSHCPSAGLVFDDVERRTGTCEGEGAFRSIML